MTGFWIIAALLTAAACMAVMAPFLRQARQTGGGHDVEVYRDQLAEVDRDLERGSISPTEAEEARAEIGRRILRAADDRASAGATNSGRAVRATATIAVLAVPVLAFAIYWSIGSPGMSDQALSVRLASNPAENSVDELIARAERHLAENPSDGRGWDVLAPIYLRVGRDDDAVTAFHNAIRLNGSTAERETGLGDALFRASGGIVTADAQAAFLRALELDGGNGKARFYLALGLAQQGDTTAAVSGWQAMLADLPEESPWRGAAAQGIERAQAQADAGPTPDDMQAAAELSEEDRAAMIEGMVAGLDERLRDNPDDAAGWRRLIRSYAVLGQPDEARDALARGLDGLGAESSEGVALAEFAAALGIGESQ
jgi:cytochrome c-type biogenesis protein CcmH